MSTSLSNPNNTNNALVTGLSGLWDLTKQAVGAAGSFLGKQIVPDQTSPVTNAQQSPSQTHVIDIPKENDTLKLIDGLPESFPTSFVDFVHTREIQVLPPLESPIVATNNEDVPVIPTVVSLSPSSPVVQPAPVIQPMPNVKQSPVAQQAPKIPSKSENPAPKSSGKNVKSKNTKVKAAAALLGIGAVGLGTYAAVKNAKSKKTKSKSKSKSKSK